MEQKSPVAKIQKQNILTKQAEEKQAKLKQDVKKPKETEQKKPKEVLSKKPKEKLAKQATKIKIEKEPTGAVQEFSKSMLIEQNNLSGTTSQRSSSEHISQKNQSRGVDDSRSV